jgi:ATP-dependent exoDNAse (exonuclease V) beta subunit
MDDFTRAPPHVAKGQVQRNPNGRDPAEVRLLYVALTRAKQAIDIPTTMLPLFN